jgi:hypothetical protein
VPVLTVRLNHAGREFGNQIIAFGFVRALDGQDLPRIEIERFAAGLSVGANDRMDRGRSIAVFRVQQRLVRPGAAYPLAKNVSPPVSGIARA